MINANNIVPEFSQANLQAILNAYPLGELQYRTFMPLEYNTTLQYSTLEGTEGAKIMADIVAIGSKAPRKGRDFVESIKGEIPKIEIARDMNEKDLYTVQQLRNAVALNPNNQSIKNRLIGKIYEDLTFVVDGVNARLEWMAKQLVSNGKFKTTVANNSGGVANLTIDFKVKTQNAQKNWFTAADADPIKELEALQEEARGKGYRYTTVTLERDVLNKVLDNKSARQFVFGVPVNNSTVLPNITVEQLNAQLQGKGLPTFRLWESYMGYETKAGAVESVNGWESGNILLSASPILGATQYTTTQEFTINFADVMSKSVKDDFILVKTFGHQDPILISTKATAFAMPVLNNTRKNLILKTKF
ncbi:major capsid protein [Riemerella columbipharyngis]|uniref:Phage major capsid protein E n=1 Tax=Riemerella columbipharyngis TaxID=1071918 RepID=A0A1G7AL91_9FLAO|nr:major capsid protein [Riemerella columbipharyngis]SDE15513.1 Phage major capsid protein E [Riemerella columbipharyngis]